MRARVFQGITLDAGTDVRIRSVGYAYGPPLPPYHVRLRRLRTRSTSRRSSSPTVVTKTVEKPVPSGPAAAARGADRRHREEHASDGKGIPNAVVSIVGKPLSRVGTDPDGSFQTHQLPPGPAVLDVSAPGYEAARVNAAVILGRPTKVEVTLQARVATGNVRGQRHRRRRAAAAGVAALLGRRGVLGAGRRVRAPSRRRCPSAPTA